MQNNQVTYHYNYSRKPKETNDWMVYTEFMLFILWHDIHNNALGVYIYK